MLGSLEVCGVAFTACLGIPGSNVLLNSCTCGTQLKAQIENFCVLLISSCSSEGLPEIQEKNQRTLTKRDR